MAVQAERDTIAFVTLSVISYDTICRNLCARVCVFSSQLEEKREGEGECVCEGTTG